MKACIFILFLVFSMLGYSSPIRNMNAARNSIVVAEAKETPYASEVEWIYVNGKAYCDTGLAFMPAQNFIMELDYQFPDGWVTNSRFFGAQYTASPVFDVKVGSTNIKIAVYPKQGQAITFGYADRNRHRISIDTINNIAYLDLSGTTCNSFAGNATVNHVYLFNICATTFTTKMRVYSFKVKDVNGNVVKELVPYRVGIGANAVGCFFDKANPNGGVNGDGLFPITGTATIEIGPDKNQE